MSPTELRPGSSPALDDLLRRTLERAHREWPSVPIADEVFVAYLGERLPRDANPAGAIAAVEAGDLYLACACARGHPEGVAMFERHFITQVPGFLARAHALLPLADEVKQVLRTRLLVAEGGLPPQIAGYTGRGPLAAWLRVTAIRAGLRLRSQGAKLASRDHGDGALSAPEADPELGYLKTHYKEDFREAFEATLTALSAKEANVLRLYYLDCISSEAIGALYRVTERTVERWLVGTRERIINETHRRLAERLKLSSADLATLIGLLRSQLDVSIFRFLDKPE